MTKQDDRRPGDESVEGKQPIVRGSGRNRGRLMAGVAGAAVVLGGGAYLTTVAVQDSGSTAREVVTVVPPVDTTEPTPSGSAAGRQTGTEAMKPADEAKDPAFDEKSLKSVEETIKDAREAAAKDGVKTVRGLTQDQDPARLAAAAAATVKDSGHLKEDGKTMRVVTAPGDLTGQRELAWVAGDVEKHGPVECSQTIRLSNQTKAEKKDSMLLCWRTSDTRSVITVAVTAKGSPKPAESIETIEREWAGLG